jgi:hypothetical protein
MSDDFGFGWYERTGERFAVTGISRESVTVSRGPQYADVTRPTALSVSVLTYRPSRLAMRLPAWLRRLVPMRWSGEWVAEG